MPFEVYTVKSPEVSVEHSTGGFRTVEVVAEEVRDIYTKVADLGGRIVAEHALIYPVARRQFGGADIHWLLLVAEIPGEQLP